jgi:hypothetical protein
LALSLSVWEPLTGGLSYGTKEQLSADSRRAGAVLRYVQNGPPSEIESHPTDPFEIWRYTGGQEFEFRGPGGELVRFQL